MELSHFLICLLFAILKTTNSFPSDKRYSLNNLRKLSNMSRALIMGDNTNSEDSTLYLKIDEDSDSVEDLAKKVLSALSVTNDVSQSNDVSRSKRSIFGRQEKSDHGRARKSIFGKDDRVSMRTSREAQMYPFSTAVMLSSGCTGTLIGSQHVLTAAHCVHNGKRHLESAKHLKVGLLQRSGRFHWIRVQRKYIPKEWKKKPTSKGKLRYDFAVLKLRRQHNRQHMSVQTSSLLPGSKIQFTGFHGDKWYNSVWYTYCHVYRTSEDMILNFCDGVKGVSGSGVYVDTSRGDKNAVVGVVSAIARGTVRGKTIKFNVVNSFTQAKVRRISNWVARR